VTCMKLILHSADASSRFNVFGCHVRSGVTSTITSQWCGSLVKTTPPLSFITTHASSRSLLICIFLEKILRVLSL
jgi:hypothetical protein